MARLTRERQRKLENALLTIGHRLFWDTRLTPAKRRMLERAHERLARELYGLDD